MMGVSPPYLQWAWTPNENIQAANSKKKLIEFATELHDNETRCRMQAILNSQGKKASVELHKSCYCSFTFKDPIKRLWLGRGRIVP